VTLLLDTQVALWWLTASPRLSKAARALVSNSACAVSVASLWEVAIKHRLGKLAVSPRRFRDELQRGGATILFVSDEHVLATMNLPSSHGDPFDRLLLAVADSEQLELLTADAQLIALAERDLRLPIREA
jgi:PIN domain nuclease of toxin-antitoxin system